MASSDAALSIVRRFGLDELFVEPERSGEIAPFESVDPNNETPYAPEWDDLVRLFALVRLRRVTTVLEFGCGFSTSVFAHALAMNRSEHGQFVGDHLRRSDPFRLFVVDDMLHYLELTRNRLSGSHRDLTSFHQSDVRMTTFCDRICTDYVTLPNVCPDFIYLDGPSQSSALGDINGISTRHMDRLPMACDILKMEHFLLPGTLVLVDGRTANARFLLANLQREWRYEHDKAADVHYFEMIEDPLGKWNRLQVEYCLGEGWQSRPLKPDYAELMTGNAR